MINITRTKVGVGNTPHIVPGQMLRAGGHTSAGIQVMSNKSGYTISTDMTITTATGYGNNRQWKRDDEAP